MNELEKVDAAEQVSANPIEAACAADQNETCVEKSSPALDIESVADKQSEAEECAETSSPALDIESVADSREEEPRMRDQHRFHAMSKEELRGELKSILERNDMEAHKDVTAIKQAYFNIRSKETLEELQAYVGEGNAPETFASTPDEFENEMKELYAEFRERRNAYIEAEEKVRQENLVKKEEILAKMRAIAEDIDTVNQRFQEFQQLQQEFREIKEVPATAETDIWKQYQIVGEQFYDHLKMNKELRDLDFKKNLEAKRALIDTAVQLQEVADPIEAFRKLQGLHDEWRALGPVAKELRDQIWEEFKAASAVINRRHQEYFESRKAEEQANEEAKTKLCEEVESIDLNSLSNFSGWNEATEKVIELQKKWKEYGFASRKQNAVLYSRFRKACDDFFTAKTEYFKKTKDELAANLARKTALCEQAEALKERTDQKAADEVIRLQAEWKKIGSVPRKVSDSIWERFTAACNAVFDERKRQGKERRKEETANLETKREIIEKIKALPLDGDRAEVIGQIKQYQEEWQKVGFVPFKLKEKIYQEYREACDAVYDSYKAQQSNRRMSNFRNRINEMAGDEQKMGGERNKLMRALEGRRNDLTTIENNMGFFNVKSSAGSSIVKEMENRISRLKAEIAEIEQKITLLDKESE